MTEPITETELRQCIAEAAAAYHWQYQAAHAWGISEGVLSNILTGRCAPVPRVLAALGWERVVMYRAVEGGEVRP